MQSRMLTTVLVKPCELEEGKCTWRDKVGTIGDPCCRQELTNTMAESHTNVGRESAFTWIT